MRDFAEMKSVKNTRKINNQEEEAIFYRQRKREHDWTEFFMINANEKQARKNIEGFILVQEKKRKIVEKQDMKEESRK